MGSIKGGIVNLTKNHLLEAIVLESVGDRCSIQLVGNGRKLVGVRYTGGPVVAGQKVLVDYISGKPTAYAMGQEQITQPIPRVINRASPVTDAGQATTGGEGTGIVPEHYLGNHLDVFIDTPLDGQALIYSSGSDGWINADSSGSQAPPTIQRQATYFFEGGLSISSGSMGIFNLFGVPLTISEVHLGVSQAPATQAIIVDVNLGGTTIFTNQAHRPQIAATATEGFTTTIDVPTWTNGGRITVDVDQVGTGTTGANLTVTIVCS